LAVSEKVSTESLAQKEIQDSFNDFKNLILEALANSETQEQARQSIVRLAQPSTPGAPTDPKDAETLVL
jgi:hypothetical protein